MLTSREVAGVLLATLAVGVGYAVASGSSGSTLAPDERIAFEVASIRPNMSGDNQRMFRMPPLGPTVLTNVTIRDMILRAFAISPAMAPFRLTGGAEKVLSAAFDVTGKPPDGAPPGQSRAMLKTLLLERFDLRTHVEKREAPVYEIGVSRRGALGPNLRPTGRDCTTLMQQATGGSGVRTPVARDIVESCSTVSTPGGGIRVRRLGPLAELLTMIQGFVDRPLIDATGLTGNFEWDLTFAGFSSNDRRVPALIRDAMADQLGLKLQPGTMVVDLLVIDSVRLPTPN